jgi:hypothetical protein
MDTDILLKKLPAFTGQQVTVTERQSVGRIMKEIVLAHNDYASHYDKIATQFMNRGIKSTEEQLYDFCKENLDYNIEPQRRQTVRSPSAILVLNEMSGVDCKHYASFIGGVLDAINRTGLRHFNWCYRFASYSLNDSIPEHVFVVTKSQGEEIWIDPVLNGFNTRYPYPVYIGDQKPKAMSLLRISGVTDRKRIGSAGGFQSTNYALQKHNASCKCQSLGATTQQVGQTISKIAPTLAVIPVIGWVAAAAGEVAGLLLQIFGNKYSVTSGVRWLDQLFEYYVLNLPTKGSQEINQNNVPNAHAWFAYVLGVPMYDRYRFDALKTSAAAYLAFPDTAGVDPATAETAHQIAASLNYGASQGGWKNQMVAPSLIQYPGETAAAAVLSTGTQPGAVISIPPASSNPLLAWVQGNPLLALAIAGLGIYGISKIK